MTISIKDGRTDDLARRLAGITGETLTTAVRLAVEERLERETARHRRAGLAGRLLGLGHRCAEHMDKSARSLDHGALLYDEVGMPK